MMFQYISDIHLEFRDTMGPIPSIKRVAPYLILAGDICRIHCPYYEDILRSFLSDCVHRWDKVIYVPGNHEFYGMTLKEGLYKLRVICGELGVVLLAPGFVKIDDITVVGDVLWSIPEDKHTFRGINDSVYIYDFDYEDCVEEHEKSLYFLRETIKREKCVVVTHHAPDLEIAKCPNSNLESCFGTNVLEGLHRENIIAWVYGHTHMNKEHSVKGVRLLSNQMGYPSQRTGFDEAKVFTI